MQLTGKSRRRRGDFRRQWRKKHWAAGNMLPAAQLYFIAFKRAPLSVAEVGVYSAIGLYSRLTLLVCKLGDEPVKRFLAVADLVRIFQAQVVLPFFYLAILQHHHHQCLQFQHFLHPVLRNNK